ncbi:MAG: bis(5'-nucleosyl)-tetraphosphatase (symmetrical) YqeK [Clostridia bacterium]|nr:bis(5'-nucleosyl)-tetraphosphatase (symmetrical) YqeK [Clostridia bacterium]
MKTDKATEIEAKLAQLLSPQRFKHALGVAELAVELAFKYNINQAKAYLAGLLHDYARDFTDEQLLFWGQQAGLIRFNVEKQIPMLLHGPVGAWMAARDFVINDQEVLDAITYHTTGRPSMKPLEQLIYIVDVIEPSRQFPCVEELRQEFTNEICLNRSTELFLVRSLIYNIKKGLVIHPLTVEAINWLREGNINIK